jgi:cysteinyl-tRNA synthetase
MNDDFNSPVLIAQLFEGVKYVNQLLENKASLTEEDLAIFKETFNAFVFDVLGLVDVTSKDNSDKLGKVVEMLIDMRNEARANKNWALSDKIRDKLAAVGVQLKDGKEGTTFSVN